MQKLLGFLLLLPLLAHAELKTTQVSGYHIEYQLQGQGDIVVLFEAGGGGGLDDWSDIFEEIAKEVPVLRYSRVGAGRSDKPERLFTVEDYAAHLLQLLDHAQIKRVVYVAHSYGGSVARVFAAKHPDRVAGLLLVDASSEHDVDIMRAIDLQKANEEIARVKLEDIAGGKDNHIVDFWAKFPLPNYPQIKDMPVTVIASVKKHEKPAHLLHSDRGVEMWGKLWKDWAEAFPQGRAVLTDKSSHLIPQEDPALVINEVRALLKRTQTSSAHL